MLLPVRKEIFFARSWMLGVRRAMCTLGFCILDGMLYPDTLGTPHGQSGNEKDFHIQEDITLSCLLPLALVIIFSKKYVFGKK